MAFTTSNVKLSSAGDMWRYVGDWTSAQGDTSGTIVVGGARVYSIDIASQDGDAGVFARNEYSVSTNSTTGKSTITVGLNANSVTQGRFSILYR